MIVYLLELLLICIPCYLLRNKGKNKGLCIYSFLVLTFFAALRKEDTHLVNRMGGNLIELKHVLAKIYEISGFEDETLDTSERSEEKASPNIID